MIKATGSDAQGPILLLGLSLDNLAKLAKDQPIQFWLNELNPDWPAVRVLLFADDSEETILQKLTDRGIIGPETRRRDG